MMNRALVLILTAAALTAQTARDLKYERESPPLPDHRERWALIVGVSTYKYAPPAAQLRYAHRDAEEFAAFLRSPQGGAIPAPNVRLLTDEKASIAALRSSLREWLPSAAGPNDIVYLFFAGHAVAGEANQTYFVAHDSDPQNLHATALPFTEVNDALGKTRSPLIVLIADACHAGGIGWSSDPSSPSQAQTPLEALGTRDKSVLKLLASRPSERSYEDARWGGGHGVFTYSLLNGLRGAAERVPDGVIRASELIDFVSRVVPEQTGSRQNPRIAGNFEGALPLALTKVAPPAPVAASSTLRLSGKPGTQIYIDDRFAGSIRPNGDLLIGALRPGVHLLSIDEPGFATFEQEIPIAAGPNTFDLRNSNAFALARVQRLIAEGKIIEKDGAWEVYRLQPWTPEQRAAAAAMVATALEELGQACVTDYVQSTTAALKVPMFLRAANAYGLLKEFRKDDPALEAKSLFCRGRAHVARNEFNEALDVLGRSLKLDPGFACSYNALGVALGRLGRGPEAMQAFEKARSLTPQWALPPLQIAQRHLAANDPRAALPYLEQAARLQPRSIPVQWTLLRAYRILGRSKDVPRVADTILALDRNYAPLYLELGAFFESTGDRAKAAQAYDSYLLLAPNFADSNEIRQRTQRLRPASTPDAPKEPPSLRRKR